MPHSTSLLSAARPPKSSGFSQPPAARASQPFIAAQPWDVLQGQQRKHHQLWGVRSLLGLQCRYNVQEMPLLASPLCLCRRDLPALVPNHATEALASSLPLPSGACLLS